MLNKYILYTNLCIAFELDYCSRSRIVEKKKKLKSAKFTISWIHI